MHTGAAQPGPGLSTRDLGEASGVETVTLIQSEMPAHAHRFGGAASTDGNAQTPVGSVWSSAPAGRNGAINLYSAVADEAVNPNCMPTAGGSFAHNNLQPYLVLNFCIAMQGVFPPRT